MIQIIGKKWHQGNANGKGFSALNAPDASGETKSGWTQTNTGGNASAVTFSNGLAVCNLIRYAGTTKQFTWGRSTKANIVKTSVFNFSAKVKMDGHSAGFVSLYNSGESRPGHVNAIRTIFNAATFYLSAIDSTGTAVSVNAAYAFGSGTWYWIEYVGDGTNLKFNMYTSEANFLAKTGAVVALSIAISGIAGTITCNRWGIVALDSADATYNLTLQKTDSAQCEWY